MPKKTLQHSLFTALENAQEYVANIYIECPHITTLALKDISGLSLYGSSCILQSEVGLKLRREIQQFDTKLGVDLLPKADSTLNVSVQNTLLLADKHAQWVPELRNKLVTVYADLLYPSAPLWSQKPFAILTNSLQQQQALIFFQTTVAANTTSSSSYSTFKVGHYYSYSSLLLNDLTERTTVDVTRHDSVCALHSLHFCLFYLRDADPFPSWSQPVLTILNSFLQFNVQMIVNRFDYYCVEYSISLSYVDGISFGFSVDFLAFVLSHVLTEGIHDGKAAVLYQGIVRDLGSRQEMAKNVAVDGALLDTRIKCAQFLVKRWISIKAEGGFATVDKEILRMIADDINSSLLALTKPIDNLISHALLKRVPFPFQMQEEPEPPKIKRSLSGGTHRSCSATEDNALSSLRKQNPNYHAFRPFFRHQDSNLTLLMDA
ncbi:hypothetical protein BCV72DRAFT_309239 [Rhizopus microsporus var. microsporus]|uniref:Uncharacterized protein n=1 Tax=Rhizopus microsporus var. microsporus TaxID=86635 RepID=A0A1X0QR94_RHIZD|nr:hypothetical protein BCV72DRAFT_309239 [Rhizopus microsporus var. microsporus]